MITPCSGGIRIAPPSRPPVVLRLSATSGTRTTPSASIVPVTRAARIVAPGFMFTLPSGLSSSPRRTSYGPRAPGGGTNSRKPKASFPKSASVRPGMRLSNFTGATRRWTVFL